MCDFSFNHYRLLNQVLNRLFIHLWSILNLWSFLELGWLLDCISKDIHCLLIILTDRSFKRFLCILPHFSKLFSNSFFLSLLKLLLSEFLLFLMSLSLSDLLIKFNPYCVLLACFLLFPLIITSYVEYSIIWRSCTRVWSLARHWWCWWSGYRNVERRRLRRGILCERRLGLALILHVCRCFRFKRYWVGFGQNWFFFLRQIS